jgi:hypothetical protein
MEYSFCIDIRCKEIRRIQRVEARGFAMGTHSAMSLLSTSNATTVSFVSGCVFPYCVSQIEHPPGTPLAPERAGASSVRSSISMPPCLPVSEVLQFAEPALPGCDVGVPFDQLLVADA